jgi:bacterial/archaeal transporter family protein
VGQASRVAPIDKLSVLLVAVFAVAFLGERPSPRDWTGIACVGLGAPAQPSALSATSG